MPNGIDGIAAMLSLPEEDLVVLATFWLHWRTTPPLSSLSADLETPSPSRILSEIGSAWDVEKDGAQEEQSVAGQVTSKRAIQSSAGNRVEKLKSDLRIHRT